MPPTSRRSLWNDTLPASERYEPTVGGSLDGHDVAIVGGGYTGLWTAWYLAQRDPSLRIVVLERDRVGFGASGRNGGWCSAILPMSLDTIAVRHGASAARRMQIEMHGTVREVGRFASEHAPDGVFHRGGTIDLARNEPQRRRLLDHLAEQRRFGFDDDDHRWLDAAETAAIVRAEGVIGAVTTPHCGTVHPLRLVHALARSVDAAGVTIAEGVEVTEIHPGRLETSAGSVRAGVVVRATEGYTCDLPGERRSMLPIYSLMIATEPLPADVWDEIGLDDRPTFSDGRNLIVYGQRTADGRFAFGGRGAAYRYGSRISPELDHDERVRDLLVEELLAMFPAVRGAAITNHWGGVLGATRDWQCAVRFDRRTGFATAGGYVGDGVATTNLAGRTLAALIGGPSLDGDDDLLRLPWVGHRSRRWEPEPLRWIGVNAARVAARRADRFEAEHDDTSRLWGGLMATLLRH